MSNDKKEKSGCLIKIYLLILFVAGIILALSYQSAKKNESDQTDKNRASVVSTAASASEPMEVLLDNNIITALTSNGLQQQNVVSQYVKEIKDKNITYNKYFKEIKLNKGQKPENFEPILKTIARNFKLGLNRSKNPDGSLKYSFFSKKTVYSELILK